MVSVFLSWRTPLQTWNMSFCQAIRWQNCPHHHCIVYIQHFHAFSLLQNSSFSTANPSLYAPWSIYQHLGHYEPLLGYMIYVGKKQAAAWSNMGRLSQRSSASSIICCRFRSASSAFWRSTYYVRVARGKKDQRSTCSFVPLSQNIFELLPQVEYPSTCMCVCACIVTY